VIRLPCRTSMLTGSMPRVRELHIVIQASPCYLEGRSLVWANS
jgi:hypothetical protein